MKWEFVQKMIVAGKSFAEGDTFGEDEVPAGNFASLKRLKQIRPFVETQLDPEDLAEAAAEAQAQIRPSKAERKRLAREAAAARTDEQTDAE